MWITHKLCKKILKISQCTLKNRVFTCNNTWVLELQHSLKIADDILKVIWLTLKGILGSGR